MVALRRRPTIEEVGAWGAVAGVMLFVFWQMYPSLLLRDTMPAGDLHGHLRTAQILRHDLLPQGEIRGWTHDWFTGYPVLTFYFPLGAIIVAILSYILPMTIALKLVTALGPTLLPLAAYAFGRLNGRDRSTSACLAVAVLPLLQMEGLVAVGGTISSAAIGEFSYGLALTLGLLVLGLARAGHRTGRYRALTAALLAVALLLHIIPAAFVGFGILVTTVIRPNWAKVRWTAITLALAATLTAFWSVPLWARLQLSEDVEFQRYPVTLASLFPPGIAPLAVVAGLGLVVGIISFGTDTRSLDDLDAFFVAMAGVALLLFAFIPTSQILNARFLPIWILFVCLLGGSALARLAQAIDTRRKGSRRGAALATPALARLMIPLVLLIAMMPLEDSRFGPGLLEHLPSITSENFFKGHELSARRQEYNDFIETIRSVARDHGCGRAHWELGDKDPDAFAVKALMSIWTEGCITSSFGIYREASPTSRYILAANNRLSTEPYGVGEAERPFDLAHGVADLRLLGMRYFVATNRRTQAAADMSTELRLVAQTGTYEDRAARVYEVVGGPVELVETLSYLPVVVPDARRSRSQWSAVAVPWFDGKEEREVYIAAGGPAAWPRRPNTSDLPRVPAPQAVVTDVRIQDRVISFHVSEPLVPILVKVSYFPAWRAEGAEGPWRVTPNQMVVLPTSKTVTLRYGRTLVDHVGVWTSILGLAGLVIVQRQAPTSMPATEPARDAPVPKGRSKRSSGKKKSKKR